jgi:hypothetical protein
MIKFVVTFCWCLIFTFAASAQQKKAVFIILDGIPADVIEKVETPVLDMIAAQGGYTHAYQGGTKDGYNQSPTISAVGYNHVLTGTWSNKHNVWDNDIKAPNYHYWNIFRIAETTNPALSTAIFSSWTDNRTKLIGENLAEAGGIDIDYTYDGLELDTVRFPHTKDRKFMFDIDEQISTEAGRYILEKGPDLSWVYLEFTDDMGHMYGDSPEFTDAVRKADAQVGRIWNALQQRMKTYGEEWMIVITTDHGRDAQTGKNHGGQSARERNAWVVTNIKPLNKHFSQPAVVDIAPSILRFMNVVVPSAVQEEMDGVPFIGKLSIANLAATRNGKNATLTWTPVDADGKVEVWITTTNNFETGGNDKYLQIGTTQTKNGRFTFQLPDKTDYCKILVKGSYNMMNVWLVEKDYINKKRTRPFGRPY